jgi:MFS family permease
VEQSIISEDTDSALNEPIALREPPKPYSMWAVIKSTIGFTPKMYAVIFLMFMDGFGYGIMSSGITSLIPSKIDPESIDKIAGIIMISLGVGAVIGGYLVGIIADKAGGLFSGRLGIISWAVSCGLYFIAICWPSLWMGYLVGFLLGFSMFYLEGWMFTIISRNYDGQAAAFSVNKMVHSWVYVFFQVAVISTNNQMPLKEIMAVMVLLSIPSFMLLTKVPHLGHEAQDVQE